MAIYEQARRDFEHLETLAELDDQVELDSDRLLLMREPTKARAAKMYVAGIRLWLQEHGEKMGDHPRVRAIAQRHL